MVSSQLTTVGRPLRPSGSRSARRRRAAKCAQQRHTGHTGAFLCLGVRTGLLLAVGCALCCLDVTMGQGVAVEIDASICVPDASIEELQEVGTLTCINLAPYCDNERHGGYIRDACPAVCSLCAQTSSTPAAQAVGADEMIQEEASISQAAAIVVMSVGILLFAALGYTSYMLVSKRCSNQDLNTMFPDAKERNRRMNYEGEWDDEMWQTDSTASTVAGTGVPGTGLLDLETGEMILENGKRVAAEIYHKIKLGAAILEAPLNGSDPALELKQPSVDYTHRPQPGGHRRPTKHLPGGRPQQQMSWSGSLHRPSPPGTLNQTSLWMDALALPEIDTDTELPPLPPVDSELPPPTPPRRRKGALSDPGLVNSTPSKEGRGKIFSLKDSMDLLTEIKESPAAFQPWARSILGATDLEGDVENSMTPLPAAANSITLPSQPSLDEQPSHFEAQYNGPLGNFHPSEDFAGRVVYDWFDRMLPGEVWEKEQQMSKMVDYDDMVGEYHNINSADGSC